MTSRLAAVVVVLVSFGAATGALQSSVGQTADGQPIYEAGSGVTYPTLIRLEQPRYTDQARRARIGGSVELRAIILPDGTVGEIRVVKSLDRQYGLDEEAVAAARKWLFRPGTREGKPVAVIVTLILEFKLDGQPTAGSPPALQGTRIEPEDEFLKGTYAASTPGLVAPRAVKYSHPKYTADAMRAKIQGVVKVDIVVLPDGTVGRARIAESLDKAFGLDEEALVAARAWIFEPGLLNSQPVAVATTIVLEFRLH